MIIYTWSFPTKENPLKPWTKKQIKEYERQQRNKLPDAPYVTCAIN